MLDEAQDANPVIAKVVEDQTMQKVMVGDPLPGHLQLARSENCDSKSIQARRTTMSTEIGFVEVLRTRVYPLDPNNNMPGATTVVVEPEQVHALPTG